MCAKAIYEKEICLYKQLESWPTLKKRIVLGFITLKIKLQKSKHLVNGFIDLKTV
jgi:hypothetical protein